MNIAKHSHFFTTNIQSCVKTWTQHSGESESRENASKGPPPPDVWYNRQFFSWNLTRIVFQASFFQGWHVKPQVVLPRNTPACGVVGRLLAFWNGTFFKGNMLNFRIETNPKPLRTAGNKGDVLTLKIAKMPWIGLVSMGLEKVGGSLVGLIARTITPPEV